MNAVLEKIEKIGIVPVVVLNDAKDAEPLAKALCRGDIPYRSRGRIHPYYDGEIPGDACRCWNRSYDRAG